VLNCCNDDVNRTAIPAVTTPKITIKRVRREFSLLKMKNAATARNKSKGNKKNLLVINEKKVSTSDVNVDRMVPEFELSKYFKGALITFGRRDNERFLQTTDLR
jgi:hypothetical protein